MRYLRANILVPAIFVILSVAAVSYIVLSSLNYVQLFPALDQIQTHTHISNLSVGQDSASNRSWLNAQVMIANPTQYQGISVAEIRVRVYFVHIAPQGNMTLFLNQSLLGATSGGPLGPQEQVTFNVIILLSQQNATSLTSFRNQYPGKIIAVTTMAVELATFLDPAEGRTIYLVDQELPFS